MNIWAPHSNFFFLWWELWGSSLLATFKCAVLLTRPPCCTWHYPLRPCRGLDCLLCIFRHMCGPDLTSSGRLEYCRKKRLRNLRAWSRPGLLSVRGVDMRGQTLPCAPRRGEQHLWAPPTRCPSSSDKQKYLQTCRTSPSPPPVAGQGAESPALAENHSSSVRLFIGVGKSVGGWPWGSLWTTLRPAWIESWGTVAPLPLFTEDLF